MTYKTKKQLAYLIGGLLAGIILVILINQPTKAESYQKDFETAEQKYNYLNNLYIEKQSEADELKFKVDSTKKQMDSLQIILQELLGSEGNFMPTSVPGIKEFLKVNAAGFVKEKADLFEASGLLNKVRPELLVCIAQADSSLGNALKSNNNIGNVGNNDSGDVVHYSTLEEAVNRIGLTLNNYLMRGITKVGHLSQGGRNIIGSQYPCSDAPAPYKCYASSPENWNRNVVGCLNEILKTNIDENWEFRTK